MSTAILERLTESGEVPLLRLTEEEVASIHADAGSALETESPPEWLQSLADDSQTLVLQTALRGLIARGLVRPPTDDELEQAGEARQLDVEALDALELVLSARRQAETVSFVSRGGELRALHAFRAEEHEGVLEERFDRAGFRTFVLRTPAETVEWLATLAVPGAGDAGQEPELAPCPVDASGVMQDPADADTWLEAYHNRPAGSRRTSARVVVGDGGVRVVSTAFGVEARPTVALRVNRAGLRRWLRALLADGEPPVA